MSHAAAIHDPHEALEAKFHKGMNCLLFVSEPPGEHHKNVRQAPNGVLGWLKRKEEHLVRKIVPETRFHSHVRGARVAQDYLLQALLEHSKCARFSFVVDEARRRADFEQWIANNEERRTGVVLAGQLLRGGLDAIAPDVWLDLMGGCVPAVRIRNHFSSRMYPTVSIQHGLSTPFDVYEKYLRLMLTPHYACDSIVCTSAASRKALTQIFQQISDAFIKEFGVKLKYQGHLVLIPLCVDTERLKPREKPPLRKQLAIPEDAVVLLYVGYLSLMKADLVPLLPMVRRLVDVNREVKLLFVIAGTGPESYSRSLLEFVRGLGLTNNVRLLRDVSDAHKEQLFGAADVFVGPSDSPAESFGLTPVEAMACGLPQVVADWDGYRDTVSDGETGFLIPTLWGRCDADLRGMDNLLGPLADHMVLTESVVLDVATMQERLQQLIRQPVLRASMSERSRARAVSEFSYASVAHRHDELWSELAATAARTQSREKSTRFDEPAYFNCFGHYASHELRDDCTIRTSVNGGIPVVSLIRMVQRELPGIAVFDEELLDQILESGSESVSHIISRLATGARTPETVRRHILFLLKHDKLVRGASPETSHREGAGAGRLGS